MNKRNNVRKSIEKMKVTIPSTAQNKPECCFASSAPSVLSLRRNFTKALMLKIRPDPEWWMVPMGVSWVKEPMMWGLGW